jgi:hypothetical protein
MGDEYAVQYYKQVVSIWSHGITRSLLAGTHREKGA